MSRPEVACRKIRAANTESEVVRVVREYLASLGPAGVAGIPLHVLSSGLVHTEESIHSCIQAVEDAIAAVQGGSSNAGAVEGTRVVLTAAARRIAALNGGPR